MNEQFTIKTHTSFTFAIKNTNKTRFTLYSSVITCEFCEINVFYQWVCWHFTIDSVYMHHCGGILHCRVWVCWVGYRV